MKTPEVVARLERQVRQALDECGLADDMRLVVAVSGGPDSLALLFALHRLGRATPLHLHGAHLDHGLRGEASASDARFVSRTFRSLGIPLASERADVSSYQRKRRLSLEEASREVRYDFLARVASDWRADAVVVGHTSDDQAETLLMNIMRGSGLSGLRGMTISSTLLLGGNDVRLVRPLLRTSREETEEYCRALDLKPRVDSSNLSTDLTRNRVRLDLIPTLETYNPAIRDSLIRLSHAAAQAVLYLDTVVDGLWQGLVRPEPDGVVVNRDAFQRLAPAVRSHAIRRALAQVMGDLSRIEQVHIDAITRLLGGPAGRALDLPGGFRFSVGYGEASISASRGDICPLPPLEGERLLEVPGRSTLVGWRLEAKLATRAPGSVALPSPASENSAYGPDGLAACLSYDAVGHTLSTRSRVPGDRFQPLGMRQSKKLQDFMVDARMPREWRDRVPLVLSPRGIAWVVGWRIAEWARVSDATKQVLELRFVPVE